VQVSVNDIRIGRHRLQMKIWADGDVIEINLTTVRVRNFTTTTTIPNGEASLSVSKLWGMLNLTHDE
jgi:miniconductance mechanosensitive channel